MRDVETRAAEGYRQQFDGEPELIASAPGRVNLIGEHTDYNGGFVLPCAINFRVAVAIGEGTGTLYSADFHETQPVTGCNKDSWATYPRGVAWALTDAGHTLPPFSASVAGDVPLGSGLSSSAAIEAATALALDAYFRLHLSRQELAVLCQRAENRFVGVNSGIMDQYASLLCQSGEALLIDCRSLEAESVPLDLAGAGLTLLVCDTRVERGLAATGYNDRRVSCERAARALEIKELRDATVEDLDRLQGEDRRRARHVVTENARVLDAVAALRRSHFEEFGCLMYASHASLRDDYEVSTPELDAFVDAARESGAVGARLTGAGFGGCAIALIARDKGASLEELTRTVYRQSGYKPPEFYQFQPSTGAEIAR